VKRPVPCPVSQEPTPLLRLRSEKAAFGSRRQSFSLSCSSSGTHRTAESDDEDDWRFGCASTADCRSVVTKRLEQSCRVGYAHRSDRR
jgi:hypothetical protein